MFEIADPGKWEAKTAIAEGECSITKAGSLTLHRSVLDAISVEQYAIILFDQASMRLGIRAVDEGEQLRSVAVHGIDKVARSGKRTPTGRAKVNVNPAIRKLGITGEAVAGRYTLIVKDDALLIVNLGEARSVPTPSPASRSATSTGVGRPGICEVARGWRKDKRPGGA